MHSIIFFGSDQYSAFVLSHLLEDKNLQIEAVITDQKTGGTPVEQLAKKHNLDIFYYPELPPTISDQTIGLCASFDHLVPKETMQHFNGRLYNLHPSLLPQYRNVSPIQYALAMGDSVTGITLFKISDGIDNGEIVGQIEESVHLNDTTLTLSTRLFPQGAKLFSDLIKNELKPLPLPKRDLPKLIFTRRLTRDAGHIEWPVLQKLFANQSVKPEETNNHLLRLRLTHNPSESSNILHDFVRALTPWPTVWSLAQTKKGQQRLVVESVLPKLCIKLAGKPKAISWSDFEQYYL
jgi:methionyl-tRNA formyltransferase